MSQNQTQTQQQSQNTPCPGPPKKFLRKYEGLKRFAAYKPPLPITSNQKIQRRQTFVKFKLGYLDLLPDDSVNLSTEVPKIAPPKIMHTPMRPNRQALGTIKPTNSESHNQLCTAPKRYNLRIRDTQPTTKKRETRRPKRQVKAVVERHISPSYSPLGEHDILKDDNKDIDSLPDESEINGNIDNLLQKIEEKKSSLEEDQEHENEDRNSDRSSPLCHQTPIPNPKNRTLKSCQEFDLSTPTPGSCILALGQQIQRIESRLNELKDQIKNCECGAIQSQHKQPLQPSPPATRGRRANARLKVEEKNRPSAGADKITTPKVLAPLIDEIALLRARFDSMDFKK